MSAVNVTPITAPIFIGHTFNWLGFGVLVVQIYIYYTRFPTDRPIMRYLVYTVLFFELAHMVTTSHQAYWYLVTNWGDPGALTVFPWSAMTVPFIDGGVAAVVQSFYAWRIWNLGRTPVMKLIAVLVAFTATSAALVAMIAASVFAAHSSRALLFQLQPAFATWLGVSFGADILVAGAMLWILYTAKANTMWRHSEDLLTRLIMATIGTGFLVAVCGLLTLVLFLTAAEDSLQYLSAAYLLGKLYSNTLMVTLNARKDVNGNSTTSSSNRSRSQADSLPLRIRVARDVHMTNDGELISTRGMHEASVDDGVLSSDKAMPFTSYALEDSDNKSRNHVSGSA